MTRVIHAAAQNAAKRVAQLIFGGLLALNLAACGETTQSAGTELTQPLAAPQPATSPVAYAKISGATSDISNKISEKLVALSKEKNMPVVAENEAEYILRGYFSAAPDSKGTKVYYFWDIVNKTGKRLKRIQGNETVAQTKPGDPWGVVDDATLQKIASNTVDQFHDYLIQTKAGAAQTPVASTQPGGTPTASTASITPAAPAANAPAKPVRVAAAAPSAGAPAAQAKVEPTVMVPPITGAPGDGQTSLAAAMKKHLAAQGLKVTDSKTANTYAVKGVVEMGQAAEGQQPITIRWIVIDPSGRQLSNAVIQRNKVEQGSLDNAWGPVADIAAGAAAVELAKIVPKSAS